MSNGLEQPVEPASIVDLAPVAIGVGLFAWWLLSTSLGRHALANSKPRRTSMTPLLPFMVFFVWLLTTGLLHNLARFFSPGADDPQGMFLGNLIATAGTVGTVALILFVARGVFARGLKGFGLRPRTIPQDLPHAFLNLIAVWPLVMAMMSLTILVMKFLDKKFVVPQHEALEVITQSGAVPLQVLMIVLAVLVAPVVEEMLFRGLFQTMLRSYLGRPWVAIALTSVLFAFIHADPEHWPALFVLAMGLGYSYEKSNSLFRPIFMHAMFNGLTIVAALLESAPAGG